MRRTPKFSIRTMLIGTGVFGIALSVFLSIYTFTSIQSSTVSTSPNGKYTLKLEAKNHWNLVRSWKSIESSLYVNTTTPTIAMKNFHYLGSTETQSLVPVDYREIGPAAVSWGKSSISCTYHVTEFDVATIEMANNRWQPAKIAQTKQNSSDNNTMHAKHD